MELTNLTSNGVTLLNEEQESRGNIVKENLDITSHRKSEDFMGQQVRKYKYKKVAENYGVPHRKTRWLFTLW